MTHAASGHRLHYLKMAVAIDTNLLVALRATKLLLTPTQSRVYILITAQFDKIVCEFIVNNIMRWRCITLKRV